MGVCVWGCVMLINQERILALRSEVGDDGFAEVVALFLEESDEVLAKLIGQTSADVAGDVHFLRGSALTLGLDDLADWCAQHERQDLLQQDFDTLAKLYQQSRQAFEADVFAIVAV